MGLLKDYINAILFREYGPLGESLTARTLKHVQMFGRDGMILRNLYFPKDNGETSEIDLLFITQKGIFVIESKNYSGWIFGSDKDQYWTQMLPNKQKNRFYNPIKQNQTHIKWLQNYLNEEIPVYSLIVFSERCELKQIEIGTEHTAVCKRDELYGTIRYVWKRMEDALSEEQTALIYEKLKPLTNADEALKQAHIDTIRNKYQPEPKELPAAKTVPASDESSRICPRCGAALVLRTVKKGDRAGKEFYGCSAFPKCRYIQNIPECTENL